MAAPHRPRAVLLVGLVLNATLGRSWADPAAALVIAGVAAREGWQTWNGDVCCPPNGLDASGDRGDILMVGPTRQDDPVWEPAGQ